MSVYTPLSEADAAAFLGQYPDGRFKALTPIAEGIENTNYFLDTEDRSFVLTIFESTPADALNFYLELMAYLAERGIPAAHPIATKDGGYLVECKGKPAALVDRLPGASVSAPSPAQSYAVGRVLAKLHEITHSFPDHRTDDRGAGWRDATAKRVFEHLNESDRRLLESEIEVHRISGLEALPCGVIHADLFRDNALFKDDVITGIIDFYYAHSGPYIYDLAVIAADWGFIPQLTINRRLIQQLIAGYRSVRDFDGAEIDAWVSALRLAALRFWLSRLHDSLFPRRGEVTQIKDPRPFKTLLTQCRAAPEEFASLLA